MKITQTPAPTAPRLESTATLPVGRILDALVGAQRGNNLVELTAGRLKLLAESPLPLKLGERVQLRVEGQDAQQRPILKLLSPAQSAATAQLKATLPKQESAALLLAQLSQLAASKPTQQSLQQVLASIDRLPGRQQVVTPEALKAALKNSGLFLEAALARGEVPSRDIKTELLRLAQHLQTIKSNLPTATPTSTRAAGTATQGAASSPVAPAAGTQAGAIANVATGTNARTSPVPPASSGSNIAAPASQPGATPARAAAPQAPTAPPASNPLPGSAPETLQAQPRTTADAPVVSPQTGNRGGPPTGPPAAPQAGQQAGQSPQQPASQKTGTTPPQATGRAGSAPAASGNPAAADTRGAQAARDGQLFARTALNLSPAATATQPPGSTAPRQTDATHVLAEYLRHHRGPQQGRASLPGQTQPLVRGAALPVDSGNIPRMIDLLFGQVESALSRIESTQLMQVQSRDGHMPQWLFELPVRDRDGIDILKVHVERESKPGRDEASERTWHITLSFDFPSTGAVVARISQHAETVDVRFFAESSSTFSRIEQQRDELLAILRHRGINDLSVDLQHGMPEQSTTAAGLQSFVDDSA